MAEYNTAVMTAAGAALLAQDMAGTADIQFVKVVFGAGIYDGTENLHEATALKDQKQETPISSVEMASDTAVHLKSVLTNRELIQGYYIREVGLYAQDANAAEPIPILYSIATAATPDYFPPFNNVLPTTIIQDYYATVSDAESVTIVESPHAYALAEDLTAHVNTVISDDTGVHGLRVSTYLQSKNAAGEWENVKAASAAAADNANNAAQAENSNKLGGRPAAYYAKTSEVGTLTDDTDDTAPVVIPTDADTLGGHPPEYFAQAGQVITQKLLWTNASPGSAFAAQTISIDLSGYDFVLIYSTSTATATESCDTICKISGTYWLGECGTGGGAVALYARYCTVSTTGIEFSSGYSTAGNSDAYRIPKEIYGIKGVQS